MLGKAGLVESAGEEVEVEVEVTVVVVCGEVGCC